MPWPVMVADSDTNFQFWNSAAQRLFGISSRSVVGIQLQLVPLEAELRRTLLRVTRKVLTTQKATVIRIPATQRRGPDLEIRFEPLSPEGTQRGVLIMLVPFYSFQPLTAAASRKSYLKSRPRDKRS